MEATSVKCKGNVSTIEQRLEILNKREKGASVASLSRIYEVENNQYAISLKTKCETTKFDISVWLFCEHICTEIIEGSTFQVVSAEMVRGLPLSGPMCAKQAEIFHKCLKIKEPVNAFSGRLHPFKKRREIRDLTIQCERLSAYKEAMVEFSMGWRPWLQKIIYL